jgi:hypothetical protein
MLKKNLDKILNDDSSTSLVLDKAINSTLDLVEEEEQQGYEDHKDPTPSKPKQIRVYRRRKPEAPVWFSA